MNSFVHGIPSGKGARMKEDEVRFVGNWFEAYSALALSCVLDERLRSRFGLDERVLNFWKEFEKSSLNGTVSRSDRLNMAEFAKGRRNLVVVYDAVEETEERSDGERVPRTGESCEETGETIDGLESRGV